MSQQNKRSIKKLSPNKNVKKQPPILSAELEQKMIHLQTLLMLSQLNSTYYKFSLNIQKAVTRIDQVVFRVKMHAFLSVRTHKQSLLELNAKRVSFQLAQRKQRMSKVSDDLDFSLEEQNLRQKFEKHKKNSDYQQMAVNTLVKCQAKLSRLVQLLLLKRTGLISHAFYRLEYHRDITVNQIYSEKSSKIQTNDSQKSKIFRRSVQKKQNRKSFSLQKSGLSPKHELYVPIKYQPSRGSSQLSIDSQQKSPMARSEVSSMLNRYLQKVGDKSKERRNNLQISREKKESKCISTKKYNTSFVNQERQDKINELQYLRRKYKKLIDQFSWFSQRFLKVIEQEEYVQ